MAHRFQRQFTVRFWVKHQNGLGSTLLALLHATDQGAISSRGICCLKPILIADYDVLIWLIFTFFSNFYFSLVKRFAKSSLDFTVAGSCEQFFSPGLV